jgi:hypothetical protein
MANITKIDKKGNIIGLHTSGLGGFRDICYVGAGFFAVIYTRNNLVVLIKMNIGGDVIFIKIIKEFGRVTLSPPHGVTTDGKYFYVLCQTSTFPNAGIIFKFDRDGNEIKDSGFITTGSTLKFRGITFNGKYLFATEIQKDEMWQFDLDFNVIRTFNLPENVNRGACFDGVNLWVGGAANDDLYCLDYQGNVKNQIAPSAGNLIGVATDGKYFYLTQ